MAAGGTTVTKISPRRGATPTTAGTSSPRRGATPTTAATSSPRRGATLTTAGTSSPRRGAMPTTEATTTATAGRATTRTVRNPPRRPAGGRPGTAGSGSLGCRGGPPTRRAPRSRGRAPRTRAGPTTRPPLCRASGRPHRAGRSTLSRALRARSPAATAPTPSPGALALPLPRRGGPRGGGRVHVHAQEAGDAAPHPRQDGGECQQALLPVRRGAAAVDRPSPGRRDHPGQRLGRDGRLGFLQPG